MSNYHQNPAYLQDTAQPKPLYQNYGFSPAYDQQPQVPPHPSSQEYLRQPATAPYPELPPLHHCPPPQQQPISTTHIHVQSGPVHVEQQPPRVIYVQQQEDEPDGCLGLCCLCADCICGILNSVANYILAITVIAVGVALTIYFLKYYKKH